MITHFKVIKKNAAAAKSLQSNSKERLTLNRVFPQILRRNTAERRNLEPKGEARREGGSTEGPSLSASEMDLLVC